MELAQLNKTGKQVIRVNMIESYSVNIIQFTLLVYAPKIILTKLRKLG